MSEFMGDSTGTEDAGVGGRTRAQTGPASGASNEGAGPTRAGNRREQGLHGAHRDLCRTGASANLVIALTAPTFPAIWFALPLHRRSAI